MNDFEFRPYQVFLPECKMLSDPALLSSECMANDVLAIPKFIYGVVMPWILIAPGCSNDSDDFSAPTLKYDHSLGYAVFSLSMAYIGTGADWLFDRSFKLFQKLSSDCSWLDSSKTFNNMALFLNSERSIDT